MQKAPKISVVVPNYNLGKYLDRTLCSIISQNYDNKEIIVVDGDSTDNSADVIKSHAGSLDTIIIEPDRGHADALNKGFSHATGDIMCWLNSDDMFMPNALGNVAAVFSENPEIQWLNGNTTLIAEDDTIIRSAPPRSHSRIKFLTGDFRWLQQESTFWTKSLWEKTGGRVDESYALALDLELWLRFFTHARPYPIEAALGAFRIRRGQRSESQLAPYLDEVEQALLANRSTLSEAYAAYFAAELRAPVDVRALFQREKFTQKINAEDVRIITYDHQTQAFSNPNTENFSKHLTPAKSPTPTDVIDTLPQTAFLPQRFSTVGDDLTKFENIHAGEQCVIVGNGPSLNKMDLSVLSRVPVFAANSIFLLFDKVEWRPTYYSCVDTRVLPDIAKDISSIIGENKETTCFFPSELHIYDGTGRTVDTRKLVGATPSTYFFKQAYVEKEKLPEGAFSMNLNQHAYVPNTVTISLMQIAAYMGFKEMVLVGCDTSYKIPASVEQSGPESSDGHKLLLTSTEDDDPNHFDPAYFGKGKAWHNPKVEDMIWHYEQAKQVLRPHGVRVINATVGGQLEVFERANYKEIIGRIPG